MDVDEGFIDIYVDEVRLCSYASFLLAVPKSNVGMFVVAAEEGRAADVQCDPGGGAAGQEPESSCD